MIWPGNAILLSGPPQALPAAVREFGSLRVDDWLVKFTIFFFDMAGLTLVAEL